jgi:4-hydroxy-2-oxoheptanedioate aldolase
MARMLELGAQGVLYPRCDDENEAAEVVKWMKFAPLGQRGFDGGSADMPYCAMDMADYVKEANRQTYLMVQIEEAASLERAEAIAAVPGVDGLFFGPGDFTVLSGFPGDFENPRIAQATKRIAQAAGNNGKQWGMPAFSIDHARELLAMGSRFLAQGCDIVSVKESFEQIQNQFATLGFKFKNLLQGGGSYQDGK